MIVSERVECMTVSQRQKEHISNGSRKKMEKIGTGFIEEFAT